MFFPILRKQQLWKRKYPHGILEPFDHWLEWPKWPISSSQVDFLYPEFNGSAAIPLHSTPTKPSWVDLKVVEVGFCTWKDDDSMGPWGGFRCFFSKKCLSWQIWDYMPCWTKVRCRRHEQNSDRSEDRITFLELQKKITGQCLEAHPALCRRRGGWIEKMTGGGFPTKRQCWLVQAAPKVA